MRFKGKDVCKATKKKLKKEKKNIHFYKTYFAFFKCKSFIRSWALLP